MYYKTNNVKCHLYHNKFLINGKSGLRISFILAQDNSKFVDNFLL